MEGTTMTLSRQSLEIMLDLVEMKVEAVQVQDREDARELNRLRKCRQELLQDLGQAHSKRSPLIVHVLETPVHHVASGHRH